MKDRTLDYLNQLRPLTTNSRNQGQQIYKNYRNEGVSNYPHMRDYERTMAQLQAEKENEPNIINQYQQNKLNLDQSEAEKYKALQGQNEQFKTEYQSLQNQLAQKKAAAQQMQNMKQSAASIWPQKKNVQPTVNVQPPVVAPRPTNVQQKPQTTFYPKTRYNDISNRYNYYAQPNGPGGNMRTNWDMNTINGLINTLTKHTNYRQPGNWQPGVEGGPAILNIFREILANPTSGNFTWTPNEWMGE